MSRRKWPAVYNVNFYVVKMCNFQWFALFAFIWSEKGQASQKT